MGEEFDHLIAYFMSFTLKDDVECARKYGSLMFGSLREVIKEVHEWCLEQGCTRKVIGCALNEANNKQRQWE